MRNINLLNLYFKFPLKHFTPKLGVAFFAVIMGYFSYVSSEEKSLLYKIVSRYCYFLVCGFGANIIYGFSNVFIDGNPNTLSLKSVAVTTLCFGTEIFPTYWCISYFFLGSVISYVNSSAKVPAFVILIEICILLFLCKDVWTAICVAGNIVYKFISNKKYHIGYAIAMVILLLFIPVYEDSYMYIYYGILASVTIIFYGVRKFNFDRIYYRPICLIGENSMSFFLIHVWIYKYVGYVVINLLEDRMSWNACFVSSLLVSFLVTIIVSIPLTCCLNAVTKVLVELMKRIWTVVCKRNIMRFGV